MNAIAKFETHLPHRETLADRLRQARKAKDWTQARLAEAAGTSQAVVQKIENGKSLRPRILEELAAALEVRPSWLMFGIREIGELEHDALEVARAWSSLPEPQRSTLRDSILKMVRD